MAGFFCELRAPATLRSLLPISSKGTSSIMAVALFWFEGGCWVSGNLGVESYKVGGTPATRRGFTAKSRTGISLTGVICSELGCICCLSLCRSMNERGYWSSDFGDVATGAACGFVNSVPSSGGASLLVWISGAASPWIGCCYCFNRYFSKNVSGCAFESTSLRGEGSTLLMTSGYAATLVWTTSSDAPFYLGSCGLVVSFLDSSAWVVWLFN